jgi:hypothetical protein
MLASIFDKLRQKTVQNFPDRCKDNASQTFVTPLIYNIEYIKDRFNEYGWITGQDTGEMYTRF